MLYLFLFYEYFKKLCLYLSIKYMFMNGVMNYFCLCILGQYVQFDGKIGFIFGLNVFYVLGSQIGQGDLVVVVVVVYFVYFREVQVVIVGYEYIGGYCFDDGFGFFFYIFYLVIYYS